MNPPDSRYELQAQALLAQLSIESLPRSRATSRPTSRTPTTSPSGTRTASGHVSCLEARMADRLEDVAAFQHRVQTAVMAASGHQIPANSSDTEGPMPLHLPGATTSRRHRPGSSRTELERPRRATAAAGAWTRASPTPSHPSSTSPATPGWAAKARPTARTPPSPRRSASRTSRGSRATTEIADRSGRGALPRLPPQRRRHPRRPLRHPGTATD